MNLGLTAYGNTSTLYGLKKENIRKERRTQEVSKIAVEASESKAQVRLLCMSEVLTLVKRLSNCKIVGPCANR